MQSLSSYKPFGHLREIRNESAKVGQKPTEIIAYQILSAMLLIPYLKRDGFSYGQCESTAAICPSRT